jgi:outer membrane protein OmpA-like peptidoglycan-associated protein
VVVAAALVATLAVSPRAFGDDRVRAVITARGNDGTVSVQADDLSTMTVVLSETTKIRRTDGLRQVKADAASLTPGLRVRLEGKLERADRFIAERITFSRDDLKTARAIQGGLNITDRRSLDNQARLDQQARNLDEHTRQLTTQSDRIKANEEKIVGTSGALAATNARIANLDDYNVVSSSTVHFKNGSATINSKYLTQLQQFAAQTKGLEGYVVQIEGYASDVGRGAMNQTLSSMRAAAVAAMLQQSGIPATKVLTPAAMGVSAQVASNKTAQGQSKNRRAVVTVLQNKGITGQ